MRHALSAALALLALFFCAVNPALAQTAGPAEKFVSDNIHSGLTILNDPGLSAAQRGEHFEALLLNITDLKRIALFTLGNAPATPAERDAFTAAFNDYAAAIYRSYFQRYSGQALAMTGSRQNGPDDIIVRTRLTGAGNPLDVDFRVRTDGPKPVIVDISVMGVWLALTQRDDFAAFLAKNPGGVTALTAHLKDVAKSYR